LMQHLCGNGIMTKVYFGPVHLTYFYSRLLKDRIKLPVTEQISNQVLALPMYPALSKDEMNIIIEEVKKFTEGQCTT
jgi:perosamine synthetase